MSFYPPLVRRGLVLGSVLLLTQVGCGSSGDDDDSSSASDSPTPTAGTPTPTGSSPTPTMQPVTPTAVPATPTPTPTAPPITPTVPPAVGCDFTLGPAADDYTHVETVLLTAPAGSTVCLAEGHYNFSRDLSVSTADITIKGVGDPDEVKLDWRHATSGANAIAITGDNFTIQDLTVLNPQGDGVRATSVKNVTFLNVTVDWEDGPDEDNGGYGLYPVQSDGVNVENCRVSGASDTGIYVGQSQHIMVHDNDVFENVAGIEIENSNYAEVFNNHAHNNAGGILVFNMPGLSFQGGMYSVVHDNLIEANNHENFAPAGNTVALVPQGTGMFILAASYNEVHTNTIKDNQSVGIAIVSYDEALIGSPPPEGYYPYPLGNFVHNNSFTNNGTNPQSTVRQLMLAAGLKPPAPTMVWDGCIDKTKDNTDGSLTNCFSENMGDRETGVSYYDFELCNDFPNNGTADIAPVTCTHEPPPTGDSVR